MSLLLSGLLHASSTAVGGRCTRGTVGVVSRRGKVRGVGSINGDHLLLGRDSQVIWSVGWGAHCQLKSKRCTRECVKKRERLSVKSRLSNSVEEPGERVKTRIFSDERGIRGSSGGESDGFCWRTYSQSLAGHQPSCSPTANVFHSLSQRPPSRRLQGRQEAHLSMKQ